ncbi:MAG: hypothetical protein F4Y74_07205 [Gemmatimonadales bacterium]|nr:hypothetical protein [Gemmatimonadales bacterium]
MKLPTPTSDPTRRNAEFDIWVTPSLGEVRDTARFREEMDRIVRVLETIAADSGDFQDDKKVVPAVVATSFLKLANDSDGLESNDLRDLASVLFLATGKSDNAAKCQFPLFLRDVARWEGIPTVDRDGTLVWRPLPRTLKSDTVMRYVEKLTQMPTVQQELLEKYLTFLLSTDDDVAQLQSLGRSYFVMKARGRERHLLTPLVIFKVRGSVAASGGHLPERLLRRRLGQWGLRADVDFNTTDVVWTPPEVSVRQTGKTRAWDFILPYKTPGWRQAVFIQCQFYAGDSGSVSHKNVDQTPRERARVREHLDSAVFVEYVDGAGYYSSLNRDLRHLLEMGSTGGFCQLRSVGIRLRYVLQAIGFLTPLEVAHAAMQTSGTTERIGELLAEDGYAPGEVARAIDAALDGGQVIDLPRERLRVDSGFEEMARRYMLLDLTAREGRDVNSRQLGEDGLVVPGYGPFRMLPLVDLADLIRESIPSLGRHGGAAHSQFQADVDWLVDEGLAMRTDT